VDRSPHVEVILLRDDQKRLRQYEESEETTIMRDRLRRLNGFIADHSMDVLVPDSKMKYLMRYIPEDEREAFANGWGSDTPALYPDLTRRELYRVFNRSFDSGGDSMEYGGREYRASIGGTSPSMASRHENSTTPEFIWLSCTPRSVRLSRVTRTPSRGLGRSTEGSSRLL
jgi:hypothetical protein